MSDIVERLRDFERWRYRDTNSCLEYDAVDEIERLRAELQTCRNTAKINLKAAQDMRANKAELLAALNYVADNTYCGMDAEWHFKPGYDPQIILDAITKAESK